MKKDNLPVPPNKNNSIENTGRGASEEVVLGAGFDSSPLRELVEKRNAHEQSTSLAQAVAVYQPQTRSEIYSASSEDVLCSGAMHGSAADKQAVLDKTRHKRLAAYMSLDYKTVAQTKGWCIRSAYRMVCYMGRILGDLPGPMMLAHLLNSPFRRDPAHTPFAPPDKSEVHGSEYIIKTLQYLNTIDYFYTFERTDPTGFTYLPTPIPDHAYNQKTTRTIPYMRQSAEEPVNYDPRHDEALSIWLDAYDHLATMLRLSDGSEEEPEAGIFGTVGLFNPCSARLLWPTRDELLIYEQELLLDIFDRLCEDSVQRVEKGICRYMGYGRNEAVMLAKTALRYGTGIYESDIDIAKVRELKSLEIIGDTARKGDDPRAHLAARKQLQLVAGLTKHSDGDSTEQFRDLATKALAEDSVDLLD